MYQTSFVPAHTINLPTDYTAEKKVCPNKDNDIQDDLIVEQTFDYYEDRLWISAFVIYFLQYELGISDLEVLKFIKAGYVDRTLTKWLPKRGTFKGESIRGALQRKNFVRRSGSELFRQCVVIPLLDMKGKNTGIFGIPIRSGRKEKPASHILWGESSMGIVNPKGLRAKSAVISNNPIEVCRLLSIGINAVALLGSMDSCEEFVSVLKDADITSVEIQHDFTPMGQYWAKKLADSLSSLNIEHKPYVAI